MNIEELSNDLSGRFLETEAFVTASTFSGIIDWALHQLKEQGLLMMWRDIGSAPRDKRYLGIIKNEYGTFGEAFVCEYDEDHGHICQFQTEHLPHKPTHWMPLPKETR